MSDAGDAPPELTASSDETSPSTDASSADPSSSDADSSGDGDGGGDLATLGGDLASVLHADQLVSTCPSIEAVQEVLHPNFSFQTFEQAWIGEMEPNSGGRLGTCQYIEDAGDGGIGMSSVMIDAYGPTDGESFEQYWNNFGYDIYETRNTLSDDEEAPPWVASTPDRRVIALFAITDFGADRPPVRMCSLAMAVDDEFAWVIAVIAADPSDMPGIADHASCERALADVRSAFTR